MSGNAGDRAASGDWLTYFGTYTDDGSASARRSVGIYGARLDGASGQLDIIEQRDGIVNPSFIAPHPFRPLLFAASEREDVAEVVAMSIDLQSGILDILGRQTFDGHAACHVSVDPQGAGVYVANYGSGDAARLALGADGRLGPARSTAPHQGRGPNPDRQASPHAHSITPCPKGEHFYVADLGIDALMAYAIDEDRGVLVAVESLRLPTAPGAGPRHFTFHPGQRHAYLLNELDATIDAMRFDGDTGVLERIHTISTLPDDFAGENLAAEIAVHPSGRWLYASNRGHNTLAIYDVDVGGRLTRRGWVSTEGDHPRHFAISPDGRWLVVANMFDDAAVVFAVDPDRGSLSRASRLGLPRPSCVRFVPSS